MSSMRINQYTGASSMTTAPQHDLLSMSRLCELYQVTPRAIEQAADKAGAAPSLRLNGVLYWNSADAGLIAQHLARKAPDRLVANDQGHDQL
jgi:hypothetical protein